MNNLKVLVATHKKYEMPNEDMYLPLHVGCEGKQTLGYQGDNTGEHISLKNAHFCELTGLYWAWKNLNADVVGLSHYRRYFTEESALKRALNKEKRFSYILSEAKTRELLEEYDVIVPAKRNYYIETIWSHYQNAHYINDLEMTKTIISEKYPEYIDSFDNVMNGKKLHLYNMFVMKKELFDEYNAWLFDVLFELERRIDISSYDAYQSRVYGFISERLFNVWLEQHSELKKKELPVMNMEDVKWGKKIYDFLKRKVK